MRSQGGRRATGWGISLWTLSSLASSAADVELALHSTATASSIDNANDTAPNAVDGDPRTRWSSDYTDNQWIALDLGRAVGFDRLTLVWEVAYALTFTVQVSADGTTWTDVLAVDNSPTPLRFVVNGTPVFCRGGIVTPKRASIVGKSEPWWTIVPPGVTAPVLMSIGRPA